MVKNLSKRIKKSKSKSRKMRGGQSCGTNPKRKSRKMSGGYGCGNNPKSKSKKMSGGTSSIYKRKNKKISKSRKSRKMSGGTGLYKYDGAILNAK